MPGLAGLITTMPRERAEAELLRMVAAMRHESRYVTATWSDESLGLYVGSVERSGASAYPMPLRNIENNLALAFSGEDFPEPGVVERLSQSGHSSQSQGHSHLVHLAEEDSGFLKGLNGRFHGLLADLRKQTATLFNDRYGMHRIYYHEGSDAFYFAAEAKAILAVRPELRSIDPDGLAEFVSCGCTLNNRTLFRDVHVLASGIGMDF